MFEEMNEKIRNAGIIPTVTVESPEEAEKMAQALLKGGLKAMEITFRTTRGEEGLKDICLCIEHVSKNFPELLTGAGTVTNSSLAKMAVNSGASFIVAPGFNPSTVDWCLSRKVPVYPGVNNPSQIEEAMEKGLSLLKFFPAEVSGGAKMLKALQGPFPNMSYIPTGGISLENMASYLKCPNVTAVGGSWMVKGSPKDIEEKSKEAFLKSISLEIKDFCQEEKKVQLKSLSVYRAVQFLTSMGFTLNQDEYSSYYAHLASPSGFDIHLTAAV